MSGHQCLRVATSRLGVRHVIHLHMFATQRDMLTAAGHNPDTDEAEAVTAAWIDDERQIDRLVVFMSEEHSYNVVVSHEMLHCATALYGATLPPDAHAIDHLTHYNETLTHLHTELYVHALEQLRRRRR